MTLGIIIGGVVVYFFLRQFQGVYRLFPEKWSFDTLYEATIDRLRTHSTKFTSIYMTRNLRHYLVYIFIFLVGSVGFILLFTNAISFEMIGERSVRLFEWALDRKSVG